MKLKFWFGLVYLKIRRIFKLSQENQKFANWCIVSILCDFYNIRLVNLNAFYFTWRLMALFNLRFLRSSLKIPERVHPCPTYPFRWKWLVAKPLFELQLEKPLYMTANHCWSWGPKFVLASRFAHYNRRLLPTSRKTARPGMFFFLWYFFMVKDILSASCMFYAPIIFRLRIPFDMDWW